MPRVTKADLERRIRELEAHCRRGVVVVLSPCQELFMKNFAKGFITTAQYTVPSAPGEIGMVKGVRYFGSTR